MKRNRSILLEIQNTKWKNPIYEIEKSNLRNETFYTITDNIQNTKWKNPIYEMD